MPEVFLADNKTKFAEVTFVPVTVNPVVSDPGVAERVVKAPVEAVVAPTAVELMPVEVVLKLPEVKVTLFDPKLIDEADNPDKVRVPDVAVKVNAPVVWVKPFEAVSVELEVTVPAKLAFPELSICRYFVVPALLVTSKISAEPAVDA